jgi:hypothetical protein
MSENKSFLSKSLKWLSEHTGDVIGVCIVLVLLWAVLDTRSKDPANVNDDVITKFNSLELSIRQDSVRLEQLIGKRDSVLSSLESSPKVIERIIYKLQNENLFTYNASDSALYRKLTTGITKEYEREKNGYYDSILQQRGSWSSSKNAESLKRIR